MTIFEVYKSGCKMLEDKGVQDFDFDARCLFEQAFEFDKNDYFLNRHNQADEEKTKLFFVLINRRLSGEPLQYILGKWSFFDCEFYVGDGVLIPRADTEILVEAAADFIKVNGNVKTVCDLCAGSGCVGISLAKMFPEIQVYSIELSDTAFKYLEKNIALNSVDNVKPIKGDITCGSDAFCISDIDVLVSNPPYIETDEIYTLSTEVQKEPFMALDGGKDGFYFYNIIGEKWIDFLKNGSFAAFECGETQAQKLAEMYSIYSSEIKIHNDLNGIERVVSLIKN